MGWEPGEVTTFEYDESGRVVCAVTVREPEFSEWDVRVLAESRRAESVRRGSHGVPYEDATDPKMMGRFKVPPPTTDFAAKALFEAQEAWKRQNGDQAHMEYLLWAVEAD